MNLPGSGWWRRRRRERALNELLSPRPQEVLAAAGLGAAAGLRSATPLAVLQLRGRLLPWPWGWLLVAAGAGELIADKLPAVPSRTTPPSLLGRVASAAWAGTVVGGPVGAAVAAVSAVASAFAGTSLRTFLVRRTGLPDALFATAEDLVAVALATTATATPAGWP